MDLLDRISTSGLLRQEATSQSIANVLRDAVADGSFMPGDRLHQEDLAEKFGVSRVPVREALSLLVADGLAMHIPNKGIRVSPMTLIEFDDITELRLLLEPAALRSSFPNLTEQDFNLALGYLDQAVSHWKEPLGAKLHWQFHKLIYSRAQRPRLLAQIDQLHLAISRYVMADWLSIGLENGWDVEHREIIDSLRHSKIDHAAKLIADQIETAAGRVRKNLENVLDI